METQEKKKRTTDEVIAYLLQSKREMQEESKRFANTPEFQEVLAKLRELKDNKK
jgi:hypothetical protein